MPRYKLAIFDFDGTLGNSVLWFATVVNHVADRFGFPHVKGEDVEMLRGMDAVQLMKHLELPAWKLPRIATYLRRLMTEQISEVPLIDGVPEMLRALTEAGVTIAVVSSNLEHNVRAVLGDELGLLVATFECGVSLWGKPAKLRHVLRHTGRSAGEAIYVGDEIRDLRAAHDVGMASGAATWGYNTAASLAAAGATAVFTDVPAITATILG